MNKIAIYPHNSLSNAYIYQMQKILECEYQVFGYSSIKNGMIKLSDIDALYLNWVESTLDDLDESIIREAKSIGVKLIWTFHNKIPHDSKDLALAFQNTKFMAKEADAVIIHSKNSINELREYIDTSEMDKVTYIPHINYCNWYFDMFDDVRTMFGFSSDDFVVGFLGAVRPYKNIEILIDCFKEASFKNNRNLKLLIAGKSIDKKYGDEIKRYIGDSDSIIFLDQFINDSVMGSFLKAIDILALPYDIKSSMNSGSMIMAFSYNKTVIVPDILMAKDFPNEYLFKYTYTNKDEHLNELKKCILDAFCIGKDRIKEMGNKLNEIVKMDYSEESVKERLLKMFRTQIQPSQHLSRVNRYTYLYDVSFAWLELEKTGGRISGLLKKFNINSVAIYGMGRIGKMLMRDLTDDGVNVIYGIDVNDSNVDAEMKIYNPKQNLPSVEAIIITVADYDNVVANLKVNLGCKLFWLYDVIQFSNCLVDS